MTALENKCDVLNESFSMTTIIASYIAFSYTGITRIDTMDCHRNQYAPIYEQTAAADSAMEKYAKILLSGT